MDLEPGTIILVIAEAPTVDEGSRSELGALFEPGPGWKEGRLPPLPEAPPACSRPA